MIQESCKSLIKIKQQNTKNEQFHSEEAPHGTHQKSEIDWLRPPTISKELKGILLSESDECSLHQKI